jgi:hypothetical protein
MNILKFISVLLAVLAGPGQAQQLPVRSGDHPTFSRLAIPLPDLQSWEAVQTTNRVVLTLPGFSGGFDLTDTFVRMQRNRIANINVTGSTLTLKLDCDCDATAFKSGSLLVLDVADPGTQLLGPTLTKQTEPQRPPKTAFPLTRSAITSTLPWIGGNSPFSATFHDTATSSRSVTALDISNPLVERTELLLQTQKTLLEDVAIAASSGILQNSYRIPVPTGKDISDGPTALEVTPRNLPESIKAPLQNMRVSNSMDRALHSTNLHQIETKTGTPCPPSGLFTLSEWGDDTGFSAQIGPARDALMNARDHLNEGAVKHLAQLYLYFGFGAEAASILRLDPELNADSSHLKIAAQILEYGSSTKPSTMGKLIACETDAALWAILSFETLPSDIIINVDASLRALNKLPKHLRQILAPALSDRLLQYGDAPAAAMAMRTIERLADPLTHDALMAKADLAINAGETAETYLEEVIEANSTQSPEALVKLVKGKLARDEPLSYETATLVEAYVQELRGTPMGNQLQQAQVIALSQAEHFTEAFSALASLAPSISPNVTVQLTQTLLENLGKKSEDEVFLQHIFTQDQDIYPMLSSETKLLLATRMMDLGFAAQVQQMLTEISDRPRTSKRQLLAARAALGLRQPFQAQAALIGITDPQAAFLLAEAKEMAGAYREASQIFLDNNANSKAAQAAWLSDDWPDLMPENTREFEAIAALVQAQPTPDGATLGPLGRADLALKESSDARDTLERFLTDPAVQVTPKS